MGEIAQFPVIHNFCICPKCDGCYWKVLWPVGKEKSWYLECSRCGQQYKQGFITGEPTPNG